MYFLIQKQEDQVQSQCENFLYQAENYCASASGWLLPSHPHTVHIHTRLHSALVFGWTLQQFDVKGMRSTREYLLLEKLYYVRNLISTQDTLNTYYICMRIYVFHQTLDFFFPPRKFLSPREKFSTISKKGSHTFSFYQHRSAAVKSEPSRIHTFSLIKI